MATAIGSTGDLFGLAIGFIVPPFIVKTQDSSLQAAAENTTVETAVDRNDHQSVMKETQMQLLILFAISTSVSLLNLVALLIVYDKDPEIDEIPNLAERQRGEFSKILLCCDWLKKKS